ncbi:MAG: LysE family translocator [Moritella sp.]|uniref:LysE family translocator n=1 Tax=Moritella sp. TaxID=78556 RepID=UPI0025ED0F59|nr:LysE family translocator [Moritella sp.]NQZ90987.1 LysE family translocator [Moritella sp.]
MITVMLSMAIFALVGAISPGPVNIIATSSGACFGFRRTVPHVMGATFAYTLIVLLVGFGLNQSLMQFPQITHFLKYLAGIYLLYMAFKIATAVPLNSTISAEINSAEVKQPPAFIDGVLSQGLNPKAWLVSMSGVSIFVSVQTQSTFYLLVFSAISFTVCFVGISTWAAIGHVIRDHLSTRTRQIIFNMMMGLLLSGTVISMFFGL